MTLPLRFPLCLAWMEYKWLPNDRFACTTSDHLSTECWTDYLTFFMVAESSSPTRILTSVLAVDSQLLTSSTHTSGSMDLEDPVQLSRQSCTLGFFLFLVADSHVAHRFVLVPYAMTLPDLSPIIEPAPVGRMIN